MKKNQSSTSLASASATASAQPTSVLRKVGSSRCLQQDFKPNNEKSLSHSSSSSSLSEKTRGITLVNTEHLPSYSTERYYMISEIRMKAHSVHFLCDYYHDDRPQDGHDDDETQELSVSSHSLTNDHDDSHHQQQQQQNIFNNNHGNMDSNSSNISGTTSLQNPRDKVAAALPPCVILYLLWRPDCIYDTPSSYAENVIQPAVKQLMKLYQCPSSLDENDTTGVSDGSNNNNHKRPLIWIVVDRVILPETQEIEKTLADEPSLDQHPHADTQQNEKQNENDEKEKTQKIHLDMAEALIRKVSTDSKLNLRPIIQGITVGLSDSIRAAPGLETCMDVIVVGDSERRHFTAKHKKNSWRKRRRDATTTTSTVTSNSDMDGNTNTDAPTSMSRWTMEQSNRSSIGIITEYSDDLTGLDPKQETDAARDLSLHVRCCGVWDGNGNIMNFAFLSQKIWRRFWDDSEEKDDNDDDYLLQMYSIIMGRTRRSGGKGGNSGGGKGVSSKKRRRRTGKRSSSNSGKRENNDDDYDIAFQSKYLPSISEHQQVEWAANLMIFAFILIIGFCYRSNISDAIETLHSLMEMFNARHEL